MRSTAQPIPVPRTSWPARAATARTGLRRAGRRPAGPGAGNIEYRWSLGALAALILICAATARADITRNFILSPDQVVPSGNVAAHGQGRAVLEQRTRVSYAAFIPGGSVSSSSVVATFTFQTLKEGRGTIEFVTTDLNRQNKLTRSADNVAIAPNLLPSGEILASEFAIKNRAAPAIERSDAPVQDDPDAADGEPVPVAIQELRMRTGAEPNPLEVQIGDYFVVTLRVANLVAPINGVQAVIEFDDSLFAITDIATNESVWTEIAAGITPTPRLVLIVEHDVEVPAVAELRLGERGTNGPLLAVLEPVSSSGFSSVRPVDAATIAAFVEGMLYVQLHSASFPDGETRGQIDLNPAPQPGDVIITEIMYNPASSEDGPSAAEWIELFNTTFTDIDLTGWYFQDEDADPATPCVPMHSGTFPPFVLPSFGVVVVLPDGDALHRPRIFDFRVAWQIDVDVSVIQVDSNGTAGGALVGGTLANDPRNDQIPANDLPLDGPAWLPCGTNGVARPDNEVLTLNDGTQVIDVVNYDDNVDSIVISDWPVSTGSGSITLVPADYPLATDTSTYTAAGNDAGENWIAHKHGDAAGGVRQAGPLGVYEGLDIGSPGYLYGATLGNRRPAAIGQQILMTPSATQDITLLGADNTRPFLGLLLYFITDLPDHGQLIDLTSNHLITPADLVPNGYLIPRIPFNTVRYVNDGACVADHFTFYTSDGMLKSTSATVELLVQCGDGVITEIMYAPESSPLNRPAVQWIEFQNTTCTPLNLDGWFLTDGNVRGGDLPPYILGAGSAVVIVPFEVDVADFSVAWSAPFVQSTTDSVVGTTGLIGAALSDAGLSLRLFRPGSAAPELVDAVSYVNGNLDPNWPTLVSPGPSIYVHATPPLTAASNDVSQAWLASVAGVDGAYLNTVIGDFNGQDTGSPGYIEGVQQGDCQTSELSADGNGDGVLDLRDLAHFTLCLSGPPLPYAGNCACFDFDSSQSVDLADFATLQMLFAPEP